MLLATGGIPIVPDLPGLDRETVTTAERVLREGAPANVRRVVVAGGGLVGCETAEYLAQQGRKVTLIEMLPEIAQDMEPISRTHLLNRLKELNVQIQTTTTLVGMTESGVAVRNESDEDVIAADLLVMALGLHAKNDDISQMVAGIPHLWIGDCRNPGKIVDAVREGYLAGKAI